MKRIVLGRKLFRILAGLIDFLILLGTSAILFFAWVYPTSFDSKTYLNNNQQIVDLFTDSGLYVCTSRGNYCGKVRFQATETLDGLYHCDLVWQDETFKDNCLTKELYEFYTTLYTKYGAQENLTEEGYLTQILKINTEVSNIKSFDLTTYKFELLDSNKESTTVAFFRNAYLNASLFVEKSTPITSLANKNRTIMLRSILLIIPVLAGVSFIFEFLIPLFSKHNETIGKYIFKLGVLSKDGYKYKKIWLVPRWLAYIVLEIILGIATFGGLFLISYTMFMFSKKRRCMHDFLAGSVVYDKVDTIYFDSPAEEAFYKKRLEEKREKELKN